MKERMTGTTKKKARSNRLLIGVLVCSLLASCVLGFSQAKAADPIDLSKDVSFTFGFSSEEQAKDLGNDNVVVDLYKIANAVKEPKYDSYEFQFETGSVYEGKVDLTKTDDKGDPDWAAISAQAAGVALASGTPVLTGGAVNNPREKLDKDDNGDPLTPGLYLIIARGKDLVDKNGDPDQSLYVKTIEDEKGNKTTVTIANSELLEYQFQPFVYALPSRNNEADHTNNTANTSDEWEYDIELIYDAIAEIKATTIPRLGSLQINKEILNYEKTTPVTVVFKVTGTYTHPYLPDIKQSFNRIVSMQFTDANIESVLIENLPAGMVMTITEVYPGAGYHVVLPASGTENQTIVAHDIVLGKVTIVESNFQNDYNGDDKHGYGIINHFVKHENGSWTPLDVIEAEYE